MSPLPPPPPVSLTIWTLWSGKTVSTNVRSKFATGSKYSTEKPTGIGNNAGGAVAGLVIMVERSAALQQ